MLTLENNNGFSLVELSIVLVIIGMLISLGMNMIGPLTAIVKVRETRDMMDADLQAITSWAASRNTIPNADDTGFKTVAKSPLDAWGRNLIYLYDPNLYSASSTKDTICGRSSTPLTLETTDNGTITTTVSNVAFAILSDADNATLKSTLNGTNITTSGAATTGSTPATISVKGPSGYLVRWVTLDELRSKIGCQGAALKIVNNELPYGNYSTSYSATIVADGGSGSANYQWRIKSSKFPNGIIPTFANISTTDWITTSSLNLSGYPKLQGSYYFSIFVRDNSGNDSSKVFVLTVNPRSN